LRAALVRVATAPGNRARGLPQVLHPPVRDWLLSRAEARARDRQDAAKATDLSVPHYQAGGERARGFGLGQGHHTVIIALEEAGVEFFDDNVGAGVRLKKDMTVPGGARSQEGQRYKTVMKWGAGG